MTPILGIMDSAKSGYLSIGFSSIATVTAAGGETSLTFSSIPQTYTDLQIRYLVRSTAAANNSAMPFTFNGSSSGYANHSLEANQTTITAVGTASGSALQGAGVTNNGVTASTAGANMFGVGIIDISDYTSATKNKTVRVVNGMDQNSSTAGQGLVSVQSGLWTTANGITSITFTISGAFATGSTLALYGIKGFA